MNTDKPRVSTPRRRTPRAAAASAALHVAGVDRLAPDTRAHGPSP